MAAKQVKDCYGFSYDCNKALVWFREDQEAFQYCIPSLNVDSSIPEVKVSLCVNENLIKENSYIISASPNYTSLDMLKPSKVVDNDGWMDDPRGIGCSMDGKWAV